MLAKIAERRTLLQKPLVGPFCILREWFAHPRRPLKPHQARFKMDIPVLIVRNMGIFAIPKVAGPHSIMFADNARVDFGDGS